MPGGPRHNRPGIATSFGRPNPLCKSGQIDTASLMHQPPARQAQTRTTAVPSRPVHCPCVHVYARKPRKCECAKLVSHCETHTLPHTRLETRRRRIDFSVVANVRVRFRTSRSERVPNVREILGAFRTSRVYVLGFVIQYIGLFGVIYRGPFRKIEIDFLLNS